MTPDTPRQILARTAYGENRGGGLLGMLSVACVVMNRSRAGKYGADVVSVCRRPYQFSCWNPGDPNCRIVADPKLDDEAFRLALQIADACLAGAIPDITHGATHYYAASSRPPSWAAAMTPCGTIAGQRFFREA
ncbi:MAG: cell wall hydrolase [Isosphaeraceae bacterium]